MSALRQTATRDADRCRRCQRQRAMEASTCVWLTESQLKHRRDSLAHDHSTASCDRWQLVNAFSCAIFIKRSARWTFGSRWCDAPRASSCRPTQAWCSSCDATPVSDARTHARWKRLRAWLDRCDASWHPVMTSWNTSGMGDCHDHYRRAGNFPSSSSRMCLPQICSLLTYLSHSSLIRVVVATALIHLRANGQWAALVNSESWQLKARAVLPRASNIYSYNTVFRNLF